MHGFKRPSFLDALLNRASKSFDANHAMKRPVFFVEHVPNVRH